MGNIGCCWKYNPPRIYTGRGSQGNKLQVDFRHSEPSSKVLPLPIHQNQHHHWKSRIGFVIWVTQCPGEMAGQVATLEILASNIIQKISMKVSRCVFIQAVHSQILKRLAWRRGTGGFQWFCQGLRALSRLSTASWGRDHPWDHPVIQRARNLWST